MGASGPWVMCVSRAWGTSLGAHDYHQSVTHVPGLNCDPCLRTVPHWRITTSCSGRSAARPAAELGPLGGLCCIEDWLSDKGYSGFAFACSRKMNFVDNDHQRRKEGSMGKPRVDQTISAIQL